MQLTIKRPLATIVVALASPAAWAQMPDHGNGMAGVDSGGSGLPGGGWHWLAAMVFGVLATLGFALPKPYHHLAWGLFWTSPFLLLGDGHRPEAEADSGCVDATFGVVFLDLDGVAPRGNSGTLALRPLLETDLREYPAVDVVISSSSRNAHAGLCKSLQWPTLIISSVLSSARMCVMISLRSSALALTLAMVGLAGAPAHAADPAVFDAATGHLRFPILQIDGNLKFCDVVIKLVSPGQLRLNDSSVGADISFTLAGNVLRIPQLSFGGVVYPAVSLTSPAFSLVSFDGVTNTPPSFNGKSLVAACGNVFIEPIVAKSLWPEIINGIQAAREMNHKVYGELLATPPDVLVCESGACADYFAGPRRRNVAIPANSYAGQYVAPRMTVVLTSSTWMRNPYVLAHEFSHVEVANRTNGANVPGWFNEGLATYVGGEPVCTNVTEKGIGDLRKLDQQADWVAYTGPEDVFLKTYCQERAEVAAWIGKRGNAGVVQLLDAVRQGQSFWSVYGAMATQ